MESYKIYRCSTRDCEASILEKEYTSVDLEIEGGIIKCPNDNCECGLKPFEAEPEGTSTKKTKYILGAFILAILVIGAVFIFKGKGNLQPMHGPGQIDTIVNDKSSKKDTVVVEKALPKDTVVIEKTIIKQTVIEEGNKVKTPNKNSQPKVSVSKKPTSKATRSKTFAGGSKYVGDMVKGQMHGLGTYTYGQRELISPRDSKKRYAEAGDYIIGTFECGEVVNGKWFDKNNNLKEVVIIGGIGCTP